MQLRKPIQAGVRVVYIESCDVRTAIARLFEHGHINEADRAEMGEGLRALEESPKYHEKVRKKITVAQKEVIESFIEPYVEDLTKHMSSEELEEALKEARKTMLREACEEGFRLCMRLEMKEIWSHDTREDILNGLYVVGRVLAGKADLEKTFLQLGPNLPSLGAQERVVLKKLGLLVEPPPAKRARLRV